MLLPEEIENQQFEVSFRGYNTREVDEFLTKVHSELGEMVKEYEALKRKIAAAELIAKDAKEHEEEFIASMQNDRDTADAILENAKAEGERIIREAKNAASGIMSEVRRRAGDITSDSRKASAEIVEAARREADEIRSSAKAEADRIASEAEAAAENKIFAAKTESENILSAAAAESRIIMEEAQKTADALTGKAAESASLYETYINEIRSSAEKLCFEIDAELKNSASRIALLGKRISASKIPDMPDMPDMPETAKEAEDETVAPAPKSEKASAPAHANPPADKVQVKLKKDAAPVNNSGEGYFTEEYKLVMSELFGDDSDGVIEDDDTYDYLELKNLTGTDTPDTDTDEDTYGDGEDDTNDAAVTSEYSGIPFSGNGREESDIFAEDALDRIFKSPSKEDIDDILNN